MRGATCIFVCREHEGHLGDRVRGAGFPVLMLPRRQSGAASQAILTHLGASQEDDAEETIAALRSVRVDWLVVDHYSIDSLWERRLRRLTDNVLVVDDLTDRTHDCDVLLNQNMVASAPELYDHHLPESCRTLLGPRYALLDSDFAAFRETLPDPRPRPETVLVSFGGSDTNNLTGMALSALCAPELAHLTAEVVIGENNPNYQQISAQVAQRPRTSAHFALGNLARLMARCDIAIGAGGTTAWERVCLKLPSLVVSLASNQSEVCRNLAFTGLVDYVGKWTELDVEAIRLGLVRLLGEQDRDRPGDTKDLVSVDGRGADRVAELLLPTRIAETVLRPRISIGALATGGTVGAPASFGGRRTNVDGTSADAPNPYWTVEALGLPLTGIRFSGSPDCMVDLWVDPVARGRGWTGRVLQHGLKAHLASVARPENGLVQAVPFLKLRDHESEDLPSRTRLDIVVVSDDDSWINPHVAELVLEWLADGHRVAWGHAIDHVPPGDLCFYLSCSQLARREHLSQYRHNLVVHESDLPLGRGWSPMTWQILEGSNRIAVSLFEAQDDVDAGPVYSQQWIELNGTELQDDWRRLQAAATSALCRDFVATFPASLDRARPQVGTPTIYPRRTPADSVLDSDKSLAEQFELLRVVDNDRYPAILRMRGNSYRLLIQHDSAG